MDLAQSGVVSAGHLPVEVLCEVFKQFKTPTEFDIADYDASHVSKPSAAHHLMTLSLVCWQWYSVIQSLLYASVYLNDLNKLYSFLRASRTSNAGIRFTKALCLQEPSLTNLAPLFRCRFVCLTYLALDNVHITKVLQCFRSSAATVKTLSIRGISFSNVPPQQFSSLFPNVQELRLYGLLWQDTIIPLITPLGPKLKRFYGLKLYLNTFEKLLPLLPNVEVLHLSVSSQWAWRLLMPHELPASLTDMELECWDSDFVIRLVAALKRPEYLPKLRAFPRITWRPTRTAHHVQLRTREFINIKTETQTSMSQYRGLSCCPKLAEGTVFGSVDIALEAVEKYLEEQEED